MDEVLITKSKRGFTKINVGGYLMVKDKNREETFYWACEKKQPENCKARAVTITQGERHFLKSHSEHSHPPDATRYAVSNINHNTKVLARTTNDNPAQIVQTIRQTINMTL
jgi:hypothetical protein